MNSPEVIFHVKATKLSPSQGFENSVIIIVDTKSIDILENQTTGHRILTGRFNRVSPSTLINFSLRSSSHRYIRQVLHNQLMSQYRWLCVSLASEISTAATRLGFGRNGFFLTILVKITYESVMVIPKVRAMLSKMVLLGRVGQEELKSLKMETEPCSICPEDLSGSKHGVSTRMTCSHVFHDRCLWEWFKRKNTCLLCRTVLYDL